MRCFGASLLGLFLLVGQAGTAEPMSRPIHDDWDAAYLNDHKAGFVHTVVREVERDGHKLRQTTVELDLTLKRFRDLIRVRMETGTEETVDGKVTGVSMRQFLGKEQQLILRGTVQGDQLHVKVSGVSQMDKRIPWNDQVVGLYRQRHLFKDRAVKPGDSFSYLQYEPGFNAVFTVRVTVKDYEKVNVFGTEKRLLRVEGKAEKIEGVQPPAVTYWLDPDFLPVRAETDMPGLGKLVLLRTTRDVAQAPAAAPGRMTDIGLSQSIPLNRRLARPHETEAVVYRITLPRDDEPATAFARDDRQQVQNRDGHTFELHVQAVREPRAAAEPPGPVAEEFVQSNAFINSADAKVQEHARRAVGKETDPWKKAQAIEAWVHRNMRVLNFSEAMATADHVARTLEGDCSEFAMLTAGMCRAAGVPARVAVGLVYTDHGQRGPALGYHMWTEVWVRGGWLALDATLGRGSVGAGHLKIAAHSWHDTQSLTPLLPVTRVMLAKPAVEVLRVSESGAAKKTGGGAK
jgi:hypothetical protein